VTLTLDTRSDRTALWHLLHKLPPADRVRFLARRCALVKPAHGRLPAPAPGGFDLMVKEAMRCDRADERLTNSVYADLWGLVSGWDADLLEIALDAEEWVRRPSARRRPLPAGLPRARPGASPSASSSRP
jgi:hypothetical protein